MSNGDELTFDDVLWHLANNGDGSARAEAAQMLGTYVDDLSDAEYERASTALNQALNDPDPMVVMAAMNAMTAYQRRAKTLPQLDDVAIDDDETTPIATQTCSLCGKPEALVDADTCEHANCPYKR